MPAVAKNVNGVVITSSPRAAVERPHRQQQRVRSIGAANRVLRVRKLGDLALQLLDRRAEDEQLRVDERHHRRNNFIANRRVLRAQV